MMQNERSEPFCDKFTVTVPLRNEKLVVENLEAFFLCFLAERTNEFCFRSASYGSLTWGRRGGVTWFTTSGLFLSDLRNAGLLSDYSLCYASHPDYPMLEHRVSRLDVTVDEYVYAPPVLKAVYSKAKSGDYCFTRKSISPTAISQVMGVCAYNDSGDDTGTVYLGKSPMHVQAKIYDKRQQMLVTRGVEIRDTLRHELTVTSRMSVTLRDVVTPSCLFYHFYPDNLLSKRDVGPWYKVEGGYTVERHVSMPAMRLKTRMQGSLDLRAMFKLASLSGPNGFSYFVQVAREIYYEKKNLVEACL